MKPKKTLVFAVMAFILLSIPFTHATSAGSGRFSMSYLYGNYNYTSLVDRTGGALDEVSPSWFDLNADGSLHLNTVNTAFVADMHNRGIKVVPFLSNHWDRNAGRAALSNRTTLINQIAAAVNSYNLDGVNVDIENLTGADTANYTSFVSLLRKKLGQGKTIAVAVAANPYNWTSGWQASYDYAALSQYSDYLMIMAYDEHYESGEPGAVASIGFVEKSIQYALKHAGKEKTVLGIPFYGRYWQNGASYGGYGASLSTIKSIVASYSGTVTYDTATKSVKAVVTIKSTDTKPVIGGRTLEAGTYTFWYENEASLKEKLSLVNKYDIYGAGSWSLGQETADTWSYYSAALNGTPATTEQTTTTTTATAPTTTTTTTATTYTATTSTTTTVPSTEESATHTETSSEPETASATGTNGVTTTKKTKTEGGRSLREIIKDFIIRVLKFFLMIN